MERDTVLRLLTLLVDPSTPEEVRTNAVDLLWLGFEEVPSDLMADVAMVLSVERPFTPAHRAERTETPP
jgi:hypothetical protein